MPLLGDSDRPTCDVRLPRYTLLAAAAIAGKVASSKSLAPLQTTLTSLNDLPRGRRSIIAAEDDRLASTPDTAGPEGAADTG